MGGARSGPQPCLTPRGVGWPRTSRVLPSLQSPPPCLLLRPPPHSFCFVAIARGGGLIDRHATEMHTPGCAPGPPHGIMVLAKTTTGRHHCSVLGRIPGHAESEMIAVVGHGLGRHRGRRPPRTRAWPPAPAPNQAQTMSRRWRTTASSVSASHSNTAGGSSLASSTR